MVQVNLYLQLFHAYLHWIPAYGSFLIVFRNSRGRSAWDIVIIILAPRRFLFAGTASLINSYQMALRLWPVIGLDFISVHEPLVDTSPPLTLLHNGQCHSMHAFHAHRERGLRRWVSNYDKSIRSEELPLNWLCDWSLQNRKPATQYIVSLQVQVVGTTFLIATLFDIQVHRT